MLREVWFLNSFGFIMFTKLFDCVVKSTYLRSSLDSSRYKESISSEVDVEILFPLEVCGGTLLIFACDCWLKFTIHNRWRWHFLQKDLVPLAWFACTIHAFFKYSNLTIVSILESMVAMWEHVSPNLKLKNNYKHLIFDVSLMIHLKLYQYAFFNSRQK